MKLVTLPKVESPCRGCENIDKDKNECLCDKIRAWQRLVVKREFVEGSSRSISHYEEKKKKSFSYQKIDSSRRVLASPRRLFLLPKGRFGGNI